VRCCLRAWKLTQEELSAVCPPPPPDSLAKGVEITHQKCWWRYGSFRPSLPLACKEQQYLLSADGACSPRGEVQHNVLTRGRGTYKTTAVFGKSEVDVEIRKKYFSLQRVSWRNLRHR